MDIQKILFPQAGRCTEEELYYRRYEEKDMPRVKYLYGTTNSAEGKNVRARFLRDFVLKMKRDDLDILHETFRRDVEDESLVFEKDGTALFDTYFNGFSIAKWKKYTVIGDVALRIRVQGKFQVTLVVKEKLHDDVLKTILAERVVDCYTPQEYVFPYEAAGNKGMYTFELRALKEGSKFYGGAYCSEVPEDKQRQVRIGVGICTFRREAYIDKNLKILRESIIDNPDSPLYGHLDVFISDNGRTLDADRLATPSIRIFPNKNYGGAGGFTRTLIEMMHHNRAAGEKADDHAKVTHALFMDDDIVIEPEALVKTYLVLSLLKEEYADAFIGGAMLRLDMQYRQVEAGAVWNGGYLGNLKANLDLRNCDACLFNEIEEYREYNAWWYCCFPMTVAREDNLPLPIFIRGDDVEYGLRNTKHLILMNGICVWHEPFENKYSSSMEYYIVRNQLIDDAFHCPWYNARHLTANLRRRCMQEIMFYRYKNVDLFIRGIEDFLKGPQWLMQQDSEKLHQEIMAAGYRAQDVETLDMEFSYSFYEKSYNKVDTTRARIKRILTLNGLLLPSKGATIVPMAGTRSVMVYRKKRVMYYDVTANKAFITGKSWKESFRCIGKTILMHFKIFAKLKKAQKAYRTEGLQMRTLKFWEGFLGLG